MMGLNEKQWQLIYQSLVLASGPIAKTVSLFFDMDEVAVKVKIDAVLSVIAGLTPIIGVVWMVLTSKNVDQLKSVAAIPAEQAHAAAATLPAESLTSIAQALPSKTIVTAAGDLEGVSVLVGKTASVGAQAAAHDPNVAGVNPNPIGEMT